MSACTHGMPSPLSCIDCMDEGALPPRPKPPAPELQRVFEARFPGRCPMCDRMFAVGDPIGYTVDGTYVHEECGQ